MTLKRPSEYGGLWCFLLPARLADLDTSQHRHGRFESLVSGTLVVGGRTIAFADLPPAVCSLWPPAMYPVGQPCSTDDYRVATMRMVVACVESLILDEAMI
jgi:hypothetical protein